MTTGNNTRPQFRPDNTRGYGAAELAALNDEYERRALGLSPADEDSEQRLAEQVLADYDASRVTETETALGGAPEVTEVDGYLADAEDTCYCAGCGCDVVSATVALRGGQPLCECCL